MKNYRIDLAKGINTISDKAILAPGFVTIADGVDLRSGMARPFLGPRTLEDTTANQTCIFSYRNKFFTSAERRQYVAETVNGQDRIYYTRYGGTPQQYIEGATTSLGIAAPTSAPIATNTVTNGINLEVTQSITGGIFATGSYRSYRIAAETALGTQIPCQSRTITFSNPTNINTHSATLTWDAVLGATKYIVFAGASGEEKRAYEVGPAQLTVTDDGSWPSGEPVSNYDDSLKYAYIYTFERDFKGQIQESGPSPVSGSISTAFGRQVSFDIVSDGFMSQEEAVSITSGITPTFSAGAATTTVSSVVFNSFMNVALITLAGTIDAKNGDKVVITNGSTTRGTYEITVGSSVTKIIINGITSASGIVAGDTVTQAKTFFEWTPGTEATIVDGDTVLITSTNVFGTTASTKTFKSRMETPGTPGNIKISIPEVTNTIASPSVALIKYVPNDGYIKYKNLYRTSLSGGYLLVDQLPVSTVSFTDVVGSDNLKNPPTSYYSENGVEVIYDNPPLGLSMLTSHYEMMFAIDGNTVRWTPINQPHAWPQVFSQRFKYKPVALASFVGALIVLCEDAVYRLDGTQPTQMAIAGTSAQDGCIAPFSVQKTSDSGVLYLGRRGVIAFDGMNSKCITDQAISARFWQAPSYISGDTLRHFLLPTLASHNYAALVYEDGIRSDVTIGFAQHANNIAPGMIKDIKSFLWNGKYFMFWSNTTGNYGAHTCVCIDLKREGLPITTLPLRLMDAHTNEFGRVFAILNSRMDTPITTVTITHEEDPTPPPQA